MSLLYWLPMTDGTAKNQGTGSGTITTTSLASNDSGKLGKCCEFNTVTSQIKISNEDVTTLFTGDWSVSFWVYDNRNGTRTCYISTYNLDGTDGIAIEKTTAQKFRIWYKKSSSASSIDPAINVSVEDQTWIHFVVTKKDNIMTVYKNGENVWSYTDNNYTEFPINKTSIGIGNETRGFIDGLIGKLNDVRIYDRTLSPEEIHTLSLGLVAHYPLTLATADELLGDSIEDNETFLVRKAIANKRGMFDEVVGGSVGWNQLVENGNFSNGLSNWVSGGSATNSISNNTGIITINSETAYDGFMYQHINFIQGHKYYISFSYFVDTDYTGDNCFAFALLNPTTVITRTGIYNKQATFAIIFNVTTQNAIAIGKIGSRNTLAVGDTIKLNNIMLIDLTQMFGTTIADYIYSLGSGAGITYLRSHGFFTEEYYPYDAGSLKSVEGILKKNVFGTDSSLLDLDGYMSTLGIAKTDGYYTTTASQWLAKSKDIPLPINYIPNQQYTVKVSGKCHDNLTSFSVIIYYTDGTYSYSAQINSKTDAIDYGNSSVNKTVSKIVFTYGSGGGYNFYMKDFCVYPYPANFADNAFPPYSPHSYFYNSPTLRGILKLDTNNKLYYDGDIWEANGTVTRRYGVVDLGTLTWTLTDSTNSIFKAENLSGHKVTSDINIVCAKYVAVPAYYPGASMADKNIKTNSSQATWIYVKDTAYTDAATFKTAMSGVMLVYELATTTTEASTKFTNPQIYEPDGIEMWDTTGVIPPGHQTKYVDSLAEGGSYTYDEYISHLGVGDGIVYDVSGHQYNGELYCTSDQILTDANLTPSNWTHLAPTCTKYTGDKKHHHFEIVEASSSYWEHVYMPVTVTNGFSYKLSMMYQVFDDITPVNSSRPFTFQVLSAAPTNADSFNNVLASIPIGNSAMSAPKYGECTFTASGTTVWLNIPGGYFRDGVVSANHCVDFLNMKLSMVTSTGSFLEELNTPKYNNAINPRSAENGDSTSNSKWGTAYIRGDCGLTTPNELTISFWCYARNDGYQVGTWQGAFCTSIYESGDSIGTDYLTSAMNHRDIGVDINDASGSHHLRLPISFIANEWHHYTFTYDGQNAKGYRDGILVSTQSYSEKYALGTFKSVVLGLSKAGGVWRRNNNTYSDLRVYATALSADDVLALYNNHRQYMGVYTFDGNTTGIRTDWNTANIGTGDFTISAWVKITTSNKTYQPILSNKDTPANSVGCAVYFNHSQNKFLWSTASGSSAKEIWTSQTFSDIYDTWTHVVMVRNSSDPKIGYFYINGVRKELASVPTALNISTTNQLVIGGINTDVAAYRWTGNISDVRFYENALSEQQILRLYNNSSP